MNLNIYVADLKEYNSGNLKGQWFDLESYSNVEELQADIKEMLGDNEEFAIHDTACDFEGIQEYIGLEILFDIKEKLEEDENKTLAIIEGFGLNELIDCSNLDHYSLYTDCNNEENLGYYWLVDSGCYEIPDYLEIYIDFEAFGRDYSINNNGFFTEYGWIEYQG